LNVPKESMIEDQMRSDRSAATTTTGAAATPAAAVAEEAPPSSPAQARFQTCRWRKPAEAPIAAHCTHRDVLPLAGTSGFNPDSWCPDCSFYKLRRVPRRDY
jgi:hypothetical protein